MLKKKAVRGSESVSVTFTTAGPEWAERISLVGEFNDWDASAHPMKRRKDGLWAVTLRLPKERRFPYRFLVNGSEWVTDSEPDATEANEYGTVNGVCLV